jgi:hypothetical protein
MFRKTAIIAAAGVAAASVSLSACGASTSPHGPGLGGGSPTQQVRTAVANLGNDTQLTVSMSVKTTLQQLEALALKDGGGSPTPEQAMIVNELLGSQLTYSVRSGIPLDKLPATGSPASSVEFALNMPNGALFDFRYVNQTLYGRVNFSMITNLSSSARFSLQKLRNAANKYASTLPWLGTFVNGGWVSITNADLHELISLYTLGLQQKGQQLPTISPQQERQMVSQITTSVAQDATITSPSSGQYVATIDLRVLAKDVVTPLATEIATLSPNARASMMLGQLSQVPNKNVTIDLSTSGNQLSKLTLNLAQFGSSPADQSANIPLEFDFSPSAPSISAPSGATQINVTQLLQAVMKANQNQGNQGM